MTVFEWLFVGHLIGDMVLGQTGREATKKANSWFLCITHSAKWTLVMALASFLAGWRGELGYLGLLILMGALHCVLDRRKVVLWLLDLLEWIPPGKPWVEPRDKPPFLVMWFDQVLHVVQVVILAVSLSKLISLY